MLGLGRGIRENGEGGFVFVTGAGPDPDPDPVRLGRPPRVDIQIYDENNTLDRGVK